MRTKTYTIRCLKNEPIARDVYECVFTKPEGFAFTPGQFVLIRVPLVDHQTDIQTRAFSIASSIDESELFFVMKLVPGGRASRWIEEVLQPDVTAEMLGPFGVFTLNPKTPKDYLMICTSTGVAPFRSQLRTILPRGEGRRIDLVYGLRSEEDLFWAEELQTLASEYENMFLHLALSDPSPSWKGHRGRVQTLVPRIVQDFSTKNVMICGSPEMAKEVKTLCISSWGVPKDDVRMEGYI